MSMTVLKALVESWVMGARKLPAAPALWGEGFQCLALAPNVDEVLVGREEFGSS